MEENGIGASSVNPPKKNPYLERELLVVVGIGRVGLRRRFLLLHLLPVQFDRSFDHRVDLDLVLLLGGAPVAAPALALAPPAVLLLLLLLAGVGGQVGGLEDEEDQFVGRLVEL